MKDYVGLIIFFLFIIIPAIVLTIVFSTIQQQKKNFVEEHSIAIKKIKNLNYRYNFYVIDTLRINYSYDNIDFFNEIDPIDFLVYQIANDLNFYKSKLKYSLENEKRYKQYLNEMSLIKVFGIYDVDVNIKDKPTYDKLEMKIFYDYIKSFPDEFNVKISLYLTNINGDRKDSKSQTFNAKNITTLINMINQKSGTYYLNRQIWDSISKVERGKVSNRLRFAIYKRDGNRCRYCGSTHNLEIDHKIPISKGGKSTPDNLQTLCKRCNKEKSDNIYY